MSVVSCKGWKGSEVAAVGVIRMDVLGHEMNEKAFMPVFSVFII